MRVCVVRVRRPPRRYGAPGDVGEHIGELSVDECAVMRSN